MISIKTKAALAQNRRNQIMPSHIEHLRQALGITIPKSAFIEFYELEEVENLIKTNTNFDLNQEINLSIDNTRKLLIKLSHIGGIYYFEFEKQVGHFKLDSTILLNSLAYKLECIKDFNDGVFFSPIDGGFSMELYNYNDLEGDTEMINVTIYGKFKMEL